MKNRKPWENDRYVHAVGQVNDSTVVIKQVTVGGDWIFKWFIYKDDKLTDQASDGFDTVTEAFDAAVMHLIPDAEPVEFEQPEPKDFEALNALLYTGGLQEDITSLDEAMQMHSMFRSALATADRVIEKMRSDFADIEDVLASGIRPATQAIETLGKIAEIQEVQHQVFTLITERNIETLHSFITQFIKP